MKTKLIAMVMGIWMASATTLTAQGEILAIKNTTEAINAAGKTRMLSMRVAMMYAAQLSESNAAGKTKAKTSMAEGQAALDSIYAGLAVFQPVATNPTAATAVKDAKEQWDKMAKLLVKETAKTGLLDVLNLSEKLLASNEALTTAVVAVGSGKAADVVSVAGRQRMYCMRLGRDYLAASIGVDRDGRVELMLETATNFESAMLQLESAPVNNAEINGMVSSISKMEWKSLYKSVTDCVEGNNTVYNDPVMIKFAETLLVKADKLTTLYVDATAAK